MSQNEKVIDFKVGVFYEQDKKLEVIPQPGIPEASKQENKKRGVNEEGKDSQYGYPEYIITHKVDASQMTDINYDDIAMVVETKKDKSFLTKDRGPTLSAVNSAAWYASFMDHKNIIELGVAGSPDDFVATYKLPNFYTKEKLTVHCDQNTGLISFDKLVDYMFHNENKEKQNLNFVLKGAKKLDVFMQEKLRLQREEKPLFVAALMLVLQDRNFRTGYDHNKYISSYLELESSLLTALYKSLATALDKETVDKVKTTFNFIKTNPSLGIKNDSTSDSNLYTALKMVEKYLFVKDQTVGSLDILGKFYHNFISYVSGNNNLGKIMTPFHITDLMNELARVNKDSVLYDSCCGTGGFLITGVDKMIGDAGDDQNKIKTILGNQIYGSEINLQMYTMATINLILKGITKPKLAFGSCFKVQSDLERNGIKVGPIVTNPPYGQQAKNETELDFILSDTKILKKGELLVTIVPKSVGNDNYTKNTLSLKEKILKNNTLEAIIEMPPKLFHPVSTETIILIFRGGTPHAVAKKKTMFVDFTDDGFIAKKKNGNTEVNYEARKEWLLDIIINNVCNFGESYAVHVDHTMEWSVPKYIYKMDPATYHLSEDQFRKTLIDIKVHEYYANTLDQE